MTDEMLYDDLVKEIEDLCIDIEAHAACDFEVTIAGNGINCCEAAGAALGFLQLVHKDGRKWLNQTKVKSRIAKRVKELKKEYGE